MKIPLKKFFKILGLFIAVLGICFSAVWGANYYKYRQSSEYEAQKYLEDLEEQYKNDTYGGDTPEETLQMFIDALKNGNVELAAKYFPKNNEPS